MQTTAQLLIQAAEERTNGSRFMARHYVVLARHTRLAQQAGYVN